MSFRDRVTRDRPASAARMVRLDDLVGEPSGAVAPFVGRIGGSAGGSAPGDWGDPVDDVDAAAGRRAGRRRPWALEAGALAVIVAVGGLLRFWNLDRVGFRGDEAVYAGQAAVLAGVDELQRWFILMSRGNSNFLLFQRVVSLAYRMFGVSDVLARAVAATFSTMTIVVVFAIARTLYTRRAALLAALLLAVSSYSVFLARLALLDATLTFLVTLAMLCLARWDRTSRPTWLYGFGACVALAIQAKIVGVLLLPVLGGYLLVSRRRLPWRMVALAAGTFLVCLSPVLLDLASNSREFGDFLSRSSRRVSHVPWTYYPTVLLGREGAVVVLLWTAGMVTAVVRRPRADLIPGLWLLVFVGFYLLYPLKAFNYLLPSVPAWCLLAGCALDRLPRPSLPVLRVAATATVAGVLVAGVIPYQWRALHDDSYAGLEEAARWLGDNSPAGAGVMTLSHGSAQYVFSFYAKRDAYPFGRFRLATVLPGGEIVHALPSSEGVTPRDWVALWPPQLMEKGTVDYLVYYATSTTIDDPEEDPLVNTSTQRRFRELIARYGGELVHTVYVNHEGRAWIYKATRLRTKPVVTHKVGGGAVKVRGWGFTMDSRVKVHYHGRRVATVHADRRGSVNLRFPVPRRAQPPYYVVLTDSEGNYASFAGLSTPRQQVGGRGGPRPQG
jgi:4-amino-4-deoxy-L-arabinose transferase-like glycosyltransferase